MSYFFGRLNIFVKQCLVQSFGNKPGFIFSHKNTLSLWERSTNNLLALSKGFSAVVVARYGLLFRCRSDLGQSKSIFEVFFFLCMCVGGVVTLFGIVAPVSRL